MIVIICAKTQFFLRKFLSIFIALIITVSNIFLFLELNNQYNFVSYFYSRYQGITNDYFSNYYTEPPLSVSFTKKNSICIVMVESLESQFNNPEENLVSNISNLRTESAYIDKMIPVNGTGWTIAAMTAWHFGIPLKLPINGNQYHSKRGFLPNAKSIFDILNENGFHQYLLLGSDSYFSGTNTLFKTHGNFEILDKSYWISKGFDLEKNMGTGWGYSDAFILERAKEKFLELESKDEPFILIIQTIDTHAPNGYAPKDNRKYNDIRDAYLEIDSRIGDFSKFVVKHKKDNTIFSIIGDHLFMGNPKIFQDIDRKIMNLFYGNTPVIPKTKLNQSICAFDIAPTLLQLSGATWDSLKFGLGVSIFSDEPSLIESEKGFNHIIALPSQRYEKFY